MASVPEIQDRFSRAILLGQAEMITEEFLADGMLAKERYNIYHNNTFITLAQALAQNFPVLCRLVGQAFFDQLAREYVRLHPPKTPLLMSYGADMPSFLADYSPASGLPYLADVARLEHLWTVSFNGPDAPAFDLERLQEISPEKFNDLIFRFNANMCLMQSVFPVRDIWAVNQEGMRDQGTINLDQGGCFLCIYRKDQDVEILFFEERNYYFLKHLQSGATLGQAAGKMGEVYTDFDLQEALQKIITSEVISDFEFRI